MLHGERPGAWAFAGGAILIAATLIKTLADARREVVPEAA